MVYVLNKEGQPLMPTERHGKVRRMLKEGKAKVVKAKPFTIQLMYETTGYTQPVTLGIDSGYLNVGFSAITEKMEVLAGELRLLKGQTERNRNRLVYRRQRRIRLRHRAPRFDNRRKTEGWIASSLQNKLDTHIRLIEEIKSILSITRVIVEVANFDIQAIKNPGIKGKEYQQGEQAGYWNLREYILHRDGHKCQNPDCKNKSKEPILQIHHVGYWKGDRTDRPGNLITLCDKCHKPENHKEGKFLWGWQPKIKSFKAPTFMSIVRWKLVNALRCEHTYGHITKSKRIELKLEKSHATDAFCITGGSDQKRTTPITIEQVRRNNRKLQKFYDAKYIDRRIGEKVSGQELNCGRRTKNKNLNTENLRIYRGKKISIGRINIRKNRYPYQPGDTVLYLGRKYTVKGVKNLGAYIKLIELNKSVKTSKVHILHYGKGLRVYANKNI
jgi:glycosyltransferase involved in cell wall biosynthesis